MWRADDFFYKAPKTATPHTRRNGGYRYNFDPSKLSEAHAWCLETTKRLLREADRDVRQQSVVVHNTFCCRWEMEAYLEMAKRRGSQVTVVSVFDGGCTDEELAKRNSHGVPLDAIRRMRERYEHDWKSGDRRPPWEREEK